jgi:hypothetical protein
MSITSLVSCCSIAYYSSFLLLQHSYIHHITLILATRYSILATRCTPRPRSIPTTQQTKKVVLRLECTVCKIKHQLVLKRTKHFELGGDKKQRGKSHTMFELDSSSLKFDSVADSKVPPSSSKRIDPDGWLFGHGLGSRKFGIGGPRIIGMYWYETAIWRYSSFGKISELEMVSTCVS